MNDVVRDYLDDPERSCTHDERMDREELWACDVCREAAIAAIDAERAEHKRQVDKLHSLTQHSNILGQRVDGLKESLENSQTEVTNLRSELRLQQLGYEASVEMLDRARSQFYKMVTDLQRQMEEAKIEALHDQEVYYEKEISKIQAAIEDSIRNLIFGYEQQVADLRQRIAELEAQLQDD